ncbi:MAG: hypothetical protein PHV97_01455, partial [Candidatus Omnitrophica bacterium]|nr:hypothetical protein [Candidatus Omnitrophota bacterium]
MMKFTILTWLILMFASGNTAFAMAHAPDPEKKSGKEQERSETQEMRAEYDKISAIKMKRYDELMGEIAGLKDRLQGFLMREQELSAQKEKAKSNLEEYDKAAKIAAADVQKAIQETSD